MVKRTTTAALVMIVAGACGGGAGKQGAPTKPTDANPPPSAVQSQAQPPQVANSKRACELVTASDLQAATGATFSEGKSASEGDPSQCSFANDGSSGGVNVSFWPTEGTAVLANAKAGIKDARAISGVGDEALTFFTEFFVRKGDAAISFSFNYDPDTSKTEGYGRKLAAIVLPRL